MCPFSFNLAINVSTSGTIVPPCRVGGSSTDITSILGDKSTPKSLAATFFRGFFLAF